MGVLWKERNLILIGRNELVFTQVRKSFSKTVHNADSERAAMINELFVALEANEVEHHF